MAAIALIGEPFLMKAIAGPEPSARSIVSDAIACCIFASPANAIDSGSTPYFWKKPFFIPMSSGTNEKASGTALPTLSFSAAVAGAASSRLASSARIVRMAVRFLVGWAKARSAVPTRLSRSWWARFALPTLYGHLLLRQKRLGVELAHVGLRRQRLHLDERAAQHRQRLRVEPPGVGEHRHQLVV